MVDNSQEYRLKYWATRSSVRSFARTAHLFACSRLLALLAPSAALTRSLARSLCSLPRSWESEFLMSQNDLILSHSGMVKRIFEGRKFLNDVINNEKIRTRYLNLCPGVLKSDFRLLISYFALRRVGYVAISLGSL